MSISELVKIDPKPIDLKSDDLLCFVAIRNEVSRLPYFLKYYRALGIDQFFFVDNASTDGSDEYLMSQDDCHCFHTDGAYFVENIEPPAWTNTLANVYGDGHWCVTVDADELLIYPHKETVSLRTLCDYLDLAKYGGLHCVMIDMYADGPIGAENYKTGEPFEATCPYFDPKPGWIWHRDGECPEEQMFGGVRERVFWTSETRSQTAPCLNKIPLVKWKRGMKYLISMHFHSGVRLADIQGGLLHFKFLVDFVQSSKEHINANENVVEKSLQERAAYLKALHKDPNLTMKYDGSVGLKNSSQLVDLGWMKSSPEYTRFVAEEARASSQMKDQKLAAS